MRFFQFSPAHLAAFVKFLIIFQQSDIKHYAMRNPLTDDVDVVVAVLAVQQDANKRIRAPAF